MLSTLLQACKSGGSHWGRHGSGQGQRMGPTNAVEAARLRHRSIRAPGPGMGQAQYAEGSGPWDGTSQRSTRLRASVLDEPQRGGASGLTHRQQEGATHSLSPRLQPARCSSRTHLEARNARSSSVAVDLQRCVQPDGDEVAALREGVALRQQLSVGSTRFGGTARCKIRKGAGRRARSPRSRAMISGDSSDACGSA